MVTASSAQPALSPPATPPHHVLIRLGGAVTDTLLIATVEGQARLIGMALTLPDGMDRGASAGIAHLSTRTGFPLQPDLSELDGVILDTRPISLLLIGERAEGDAHALSTVRGLGVVRYFSIPSTPPHRPERQPDWPDAVLAAWRFGKIDVVLVDVPDGPLPVWVAQLFNAVNAADEFPPLLVIAADARIAELMPRHGRMLTRGEHLPEQLATALAEGQALRLLPTCGTPPATVFRRQALVTALIAAQRATNTTICYIDIAAGTTLISANSTRADVVFEPQLDCGAGAPSLLAPTRAEEMTRWLPLGGNLDSARRWAIWRAAWPSAVLTDPTDRVMAAAFARVAIERVGDPDALAAADTIILGPGWLRWATPIEMLNVISDVIAPPNPVHVALDADDMLAATGFLAHVRPEDAETVFAHDALRPIGSVIAAPARAQRNVSPVRATIMGAGVAHQREIPGGTVQRLPIEEAVTLELARDGSIAPLHAILPSECGLLIDTRPRPLTAARMAEPRGTVSDRLRTSS